MTSKESDEVEIEWFDDSSHTFVMEVKLVFRRTNILENPNYGNVISKGAYKLYKFKLLNVQILLIWIFSLWMCTLDDVL